MRSSAKQRIDDLRQQIEHHNHCYYVLSSPEITDYDYDMMIKELEALERDYPEFDDPLSPTHRVGSDLTHGFEQSRHEYPMLSLSNTYSVGEVDEFMKRVRDALSDQEVVVVGELKYDGTSISLTYEDGRLVRAVTRGDGEKGDVVTDNVKTIRSVPLTLNGDGWPRKFEIRGEVVLPWETFDRINTERVFNEEQPFANPRNAASGTLKLQSPAEVSRRGLDAVFYYLIGDNLPADTHLGNMEAAKQWGFKVAPIMTPLHDVAEVDRFIAHWDSARKELPIATDGLVFKVNSLRQQLNLGFTAKSPRWAIAYKFAAERALTQLHFVSFEVGRSGVITPVANLEPVLLSGTIVKRASLHNEDIIRTLDIHEHDMVYVEKGGEIIPKITGVDVEARSNDASPIKFIEYCPACGTPLVRVEGEAAWTCPNKWGCPPQICGRIEHYVGRRMMNIDGIGQEMVQMLYERGLVRNIADLYDLYTHREELAALPGMGEKSADRIIDGIRQSVDVPFERVIFALSIPDVGETGAKRIARALHDIDTLMNATAEQLVDIDDVGPRIATSIIEYFANPINRDIIERLRSAGVKMSVPDDEGANRSNILAGAQIVISGTFALHSRDEYKELIELNGGKNVSSISKKTTYVLAGENMGPAKLEKAQKLGVTILDENRFLEMIAPTAKTESGDETIEPVQQTLF